LKLKILHLLSQRPEATGSGIYIQAMIREAGNRGHENFLLAGIPRGNMPDLETLGNCPCEFICFDGGDLPFPVVGMSDVMPYPSRRFCDLSEKELEDYERALGKKLRQVVRTFRPDIIHSHHLWILTSLGRQMFPDIPMVTSCHGSDLRQFQNCPHLRERVKAGCRNLDAVMALTRDQKAVIEELYEVPPGRVHVVGAGFNDRLFCAGTKPDPVPVEIVYAGKLSRAKGVPWMLRALGRLGHLSWRLHLVGGGAGPEKAECLELARKLGDRVKIYGPVPQTELARVMKSAHIFVLPSFFEGLPLVLPEALACGCRLVSTSLPGVAELFGDFGTDYIRLVAPPRLRNADVPYEEDEEIFETDISEALESQITAAKNTPTIDLTQIAGLLGRYSWGGVFERVEAVFP